MTINLTRQFALAALFGVLVVMTAAADDKVRVAEKAASAETAETNRNLATRANTVAVEEAIKAVLAENKLDLDIRLSGRTSENIVGGP